jgi:hypothetical protein
MNDVTKYLNPNNIAESRQQKIDIVVKALVQGARALHMNPIVNRGGKKTTRLPLVTWVGGENENGVTGRFFILGILTKQVGATIADIVMALHQIQQKHLAYVDTVGIRVQDFKDVCELLENALFVRGNGKQAVGLDFDSKIYVRDLNQPAPTTGSKGKPIIVPDWLTAEDAPAELLTVFGGGDIS